MFAAPQVIQQGNQYHVQHGTDAGLFVQFTMEAIQDEEETIKQGRPIFHDREFIKIIPVGDKSTVICRPVKHTFDANTPPDPQRWPKQYEAFKAQQEQPLDGTPLTEWPPLSKSQVATLRAVNVHTVEALSQVSDTNLNNLGMGARELRDKALAYLAQAKDGAGFNQLQEENKNLKTQLEALQNQMAALSAQVEKKTNSKKSAETEVTNG